MAMYQQSCSWCGDVGHVYAYCPFVQGDEESEQVFNCEPSYFPSSSDNCNFYHNAAFSNFNNLEPQPAPPEPFITQAEIDFMHEQSKINQMMFEQMQAVSAQLAGLAAHSKIIGNQLSQQATTAPQPRGQLPSQPELLPEETVTHTDRVQSTRPVQPEETSAEPEPLPEETMTHTDRVQSTRAVQKEADNQGKEEVLMCSQKELTHGPYASHTDRARQSEGMDNEEAHGSHKAHTGAAHGPDTYHTDRALAAWSLHSIPWYFRPPRCAEIHPTHHPPVSEVPPLHPSLHVW